MRFLSLFAAIVAGPALAQDFSEGSEAKSWNLAAERPARFAARVVDPLCELAGDCTEACGDGRRQLALLREADGVLVLPLKNNQPLFTGAARELAPFCGAAVEVDGLMLDDAELGAMNLYQVQRIRALDGGDWQPANRWTKVWAEENPDAEGEGPWFRRDPQVAERIDADGWLGLGPDREDAFLRDWLGVE